MRRGRMLWGYIEKLSESTYNGRTDKFIFRGRLASESFDLTYLTHFTDGVGPYFSDSAPGLNLRLDRRLRRQGPIMQLRRRFGLGPLPASQHSSLVFGLNLRVGLQLRNKFLTRNSVRNCSGPRKLSFSVRRINTGSLYIISTDN